MRGMVRLVYSTDSFRDGSPRGCEPRSADLTAEDALVGRKGLASTMSEAESPKRAPVVRVVVVLRWPILAVAHDCLRATPTVRLRVCADDVGVMPRRARHLARFAPCLQIREGWNGAEDLARQVRSASGGGQRSGRHRGEVVPEWSAFPVDSHARHLGYIIGPGVGRHLWAQPIAKWEARAAEVAQRSPPVAFVAPSTEESTASVPAHWPSRCRTARRHTELV